MIVDGHSLRLAMIETVCQQGTSRQTTSIDANDAITEAFAASLEQLVNGPSTSESLQGAPERLAATMDGVANAGKAWPLLKSVNFALLRLIKPTKAAAIVTSVKNEGLYLLEWLAHHKAVGFQKFIIYTNNNTDSSEELLEILHKYGEISLVMNEILPETPPQIKAYEHSIHFRNDLRDYEWVAYLDADELLIPSDVHDFAIGPFLNAAIRRWAPRKPDAICLNWDWYGSDGQIARGQGLVQERFQYARRHRGVKSIVRLPTLTTMWPIHIPDPGQAFCINSCFERVEMTDWTMDVACKDGAKINHYYQKSFEEFGVKTMRGPGSAPGGILHRDMKSFFLRRYHKGKWNIPSNPKNTV